MIDPASEVHDDVVGPDAVRTTAPSMAEGATQASSAPRTGEPAVDEVLASLDRLDGLPLTGHVAVFETAHELLRSALTGAADRPQPR